jgi:hypothetical protein
MVIDEVISDIESSCPAGITSPESVTVAKPVRIAGATVPLDALVRTIPFTV